MKFSIRDLIGAVTVVGLVIGFVLVQRDRLLLLDECANLRARVAELKDHRATYRLLLMGAEASVAGVTFDEKWRGGRDGFKLLAERGAMWELVLSRSPFDDEDAEILADLEVANLDVSFTALSDRSIETLTRVKGLQTLRVFGAKFSPEGVEELRSRLPGVKIIDQERKRHED